uniref:Uncharacterized protein n=1 Tax=Aegilops tauschii subsp. strangulata TaxID=200361 RepID=A0A452Z0Y8_AEGTS
MKVPCFLQWQEGEWEDHRSGSVWLREINGDEFTTMFLPYFGNMVQRVVSEEVEKAKFKQFSAAAATPPRSARQRSQED